MGRLATISEKPLHCATAWLHRASAAAGQSPVLIASGTGWCSSNERLTRLATRSWSRWCGKPCGAPVERFHPGDGARLERIHPATHLSQKGLREGFGAMANDLHDLLHDLPMAEACHQRYADHGVSALSPELKLELSGLASKPAS